MTSNSAWMAAKRKQHKKEKKRIEKTRKEEQKRRFPDQEGIHAKGASCVCTPGTNVYCWGYKRSNGVNNNAQLSKICPRCEKIIECKDKRTSNWTRRDKEYGWYIRKCKNCGLSQQLGYEDAE